LQLKTCLFTEKRLSINGLVVVHGRLIKQAVELGVIRQSDNWTARAGHYLPAWA